MSVSPLIESEAEAPEPEGGEAQQALGGGLTSQIARVFAENRLAVAGLVIIVLAILFCWVGPLVYPTNQTNAQLALFAPSNAPPSSQYPLGTDAQGYDMLGRIMYGGQISLLVGFAAALIATILGVLVGAVSGFFGGAVDSVLMRLVDILLSVPILYLLIVLAVIFTPSVGILILVIGFTAWPAAAHHTHGLHELAHAQR